MVDIMWCLKDDAKLMLLLDLDVPKQCDGKIKPFDLVTCAIVAADLLRQFLGCANAL